MTKSADSPIAKSWEGDHLNRVEVAKYLTTYLNSIYAESDPNLSEGHFVLGINATWGHGKTFLLKKWAEDLAKAKYPVVTFDTWANDFSKDPLVGFMSELYEALDPWLKDIAPAKAAMKKVKKSVTKVLSAGVGIVAGGAAAGLAEAGLNMFTGKLDISENTTDAIAGSVADNAGRIAEKALKEHKEIKQAISEFKKNLEGLIKAIEGNKKGKQLPLYIFIDELDRCRPTYAIELLENIKHLFGVKGVFFIVAINKEQLCHSIQAVYGNSFDSAAYLGRFFDQEYTLPEPDNLRYANHLFEKYKIHDEARLFISKAKSPQTPNHLAQTFAILSDAFDLPLRDQEQTIHRIKAILANYQHDPVYFEYLMFLLMLRKKSEPLFNTFPVEYVKDRTSYEPELSKVFKGHKKIKVPKVTYHGGTVGAVDESLFALMHLYASMALKDIDTLHKELSNFEEGIITKAILYREASAYKSPSLAICEYPKLVRQVGQLS